MFPLGASAVTRRKTLTGKLEGMQTQMTAAEGSARHLETARKRLWDMEGQLAILEALKASFSLDGLMKRRLEQKMSAKTAQVG